MPFPRPERVQPLTLTAVTEVLGPDAARLVDPSAGDVEVTGVSLDTATVRPGDLWAALPGARVHGADFVAAAAEAGAVAVLTDADGVSRIAAKGVDLPLIEVTAPRSRLGEVTAALS